MHLTSFIKYFVFSIIFATGLPDKILAGSEVPGAGLLYYGKFHWAYDTAPVDSPFMAGALFQIYWADYEKAEGEIDWSRLDKAIDPWLDAGKGVAIRMMWSSSGYWDDPSANRPTPHWVLDKGAVHAWHEASETEIPLFWDPIYQRYALRFLEQLRDHLGDRGGILFLDITPGAETNPYRFGTINRIDPGFRETFTSLPASDGRIYSEELWKETVLDFIDDAHAVYKDTNMPLLVTLNTGGMENLGQFSLYGDHCVDLGIYVGQNGLRATSYLEMNNRKQNFLEWSKHTRIFFEMVQKSGGATGPLMGVMEAAERVNTSFLNVYPEDTLASLEGPCSERMPFIEALAYGSANLKAMEKARQAKKSK